MLHKHDTILNTTHFIYISYYVTPEKCSGMWNPRHIQIAISDYLVWGELWLWPESCISPVELVWPWGNIKPTELLEWGSILDLSENELDEAMVIYGAIGMSDGP